MTDKDRKIEEWLRANGVTQFHKVEEFDLKQIDEGKSLTNQARYSARDEDRVLMIAEGLLQTTPEKVDPLVLYGLPKGGYMVIDGNHRHGGAQLIDWTKLPAYVIDERLSEAQLRVLTFTANIGRGWDTSLEERLSQAVYLVENFDSKIEDAAHEMQVPLGQVKNKVTVLRSRKRIEQAGLDPERIGVGNSGRLASLPSDPVLKAAGKLVMDSRMSQVQVGDLVTQLRQLRSEREQLALIKEERDRAVLHTKVTAGGKLPLPRIVQRARTALTSISRLDVGELRSAKVDSSVREQVKVSAQEARKRIDAILETL